MQEEVGPYLAMASLLQSQVMPYLLSFHLHQSLTLQHRQHGFLCVTSFLQENIEILATGFFTVCKSKSLHLKATWVHLNNQILLGTTTALRHVLEWDRSIINI